MPEQLFTIVQITYTIVLPLVVGFMAKQIKGHSNSKEADMLILRIVLIEIHDRYVPTGKIPRDTFKTFQDIWKLYHDGYDGNSLTDRFHDEVNQLTII